jgi:hypothetical protein
MILKEVVRIIYSSDDLRSNGTHFNKKARAPAGALDFFARPTWAAHDFRGPPMVLMSCEAMRHN